MWAVMPKGTDTVLIITRSASNGGGPHPWSPAVEESEVRTHFTLYTIV
jgi:hypothetical protein